MGQERPNAGLGSRLSSTDKITAASVKAQGLLWAKPCGADFQRAGDLAGKLGGGWLCLGHIHVPLETAC